MRFALVCAVLGVTVVSEARIGPTSLFMLTASSPVIVVADVTQIVDRGGVRVGVAKVTRAINGAQVGDVLEIVAASIWTCDSSNAEAGETVLLYLSPVSQTAGVSLLGLDLAAARLASEAEGRTLYRIEHHGNGRMIVQGEGAERWIEAEVPKYVDGWRLGYYVLMPPKMEMFEVRNGEDRGPKMVAKVRAEDVLSYTIGVIKMLEFGAWLQSLTKEKQPTAQ